MKKQTKAVLTGSSPLTLVPKTRPSYEDITLVNPAKESLTPAILKNWEGFEATSDEEAQNICSTSLLFAQLLLEFLALKNTNIIDNQPVVYLNNRNEAPVIEINRAQLKTTKNNAA